MRITIDGRRFEISTNSRIERAKLAASARKVKGQSEDARTINMNLDALRRKAFDDRQEILSREQSFTIDSFKFKWSGIGESKHSIMEVIRNHNADLEKPIGKDTIASRRGMTAFTSACSVRSTGTGKKAPRLPFTGGCCPISGPLSISRNAPR